MQQFEKVLHAPSQEIAIHRASAAYPNMQFVSVDAQQLDPKTAAPAQQQNAATPSPTGQMPGFKPLQPLQGLKPTFPQNAQQQQPAAQAPVREAALLPFNPYWFSYPYSISLPTRFSRILRETAPSEVITHDGHYSIVLESEDEMRRFLSKLISHYDQQAYNLIVAGIRSSFG